MRRNKDVTLGTRRSEIVLADATLIASTVQACRQRLSGFVQRYLPCFYRREQREHAELVLRGKLSHLDRKTCEPISREAGLARRPVQMFVGAGEWDDEWVMSELRRHVTEEFHDPDSTFVIDGSAFPKKGTASCGVKRQWCGRFANVATQRTKLIDGSPVTHRPVLFLFRHPSQQDIHTGIRRVVR